MKKKKRKEKKKVLNEKFVEFIVVGFQIF